MSSTPTVLHKLTPTVKQQLLRGLERTLNEARESGNAFMVVVFTAQGEVTMLQTSDRFRIVQEGTHRTAGS